MIATALSNINNKICVIINVIRIILEAIAVWFPKSVIRRCPATIFAIRRTERVTGRITFLIDSIKTIKGIRADGVLCGTKWENMWLVLLIQPNIINVSQRGKAKTRVKEIWLEAVKIYGNKPKKLFIIINIKIEMKMNEEPWNDVGPKSILNSIWSFIIVFLVINVNFLGIIQKAGMINEMIVKELIQFKDILDLVEGSNTLNKLVIIFNFY